MSNSTKAASFQNITLWIFAAVGFLASIVAVYSFLSSDAAQLRVSAYAQTAEMPRIISDQFTEGDDNLTAFGSVLEQASCPGSAKPDEHICEHAKRLKQIDTQVRKFQYPINAFYNLKISNEGDAIARNIRLDAEGIALIEAENEKGSELSLTKDVKRDSYVLPDLNPGERINLRVWSSGGLPYDYSNMYDETKYIPSVTYGDGRASTQVFSHAPSAYVELWDALSTFPVFVTICLLIVVCFLVTGAVITLLSLIVGLFQGKSLKEIFSTQPTQAPQQTPTAP